ncbi:CLUMA_CG021270, isoform A [Clunio marinus]|uniref:CLUMA_CG021270, isoform A n=1 Tax=Clunio marinus TaxID=568069 RepID=A0A1J1J8G6_9DIPT|nr:CLUMA_CG021270, isoform A [Clunio marinus]
MLKDLMNQDQQSPEKCSGCGTTIRDRYYLLTGDQAFHISCLRCCRCSQNLDTELSCYSRDGLIYCKEDYYRIFSIRRCARCGAGIGSSDLVMRARDLIFHVNCFSCALCGLPLSAGDTAGIRGGRVFCCEHYETELQLETSNIPLQQIPYYPPTTTQQKGRPRKRKTALQTDETVITNSDGNPEHHLSQDGALRLELMNASELNPNSMEMSSYDGSQSPRSSGAMTPNSRNKRMRTSFKHHQLRTMKSYFAINQNPDAKDLKQLAQKTGLSKRVLQVWFQNARAKWRRNVMRQDGGIQNPNCPPNITSYTSTEIHTPNSSESDAMTPSHSHALEEMHNMSCMELY